MVNAVTVNCLSKKLIPLIISLINKKLIIPNNISLVIDNTEVT